MKRKFSIVMLVSVIVLSALFAGNASAQIIGGRDASTNAAPNSPASANAILNYQGRLTNSTGAPINSTVNMVFKIYDSSNALVWTSGAHSITPINGLFTAKLGASPDPILTSGILASTVSIGVTVGSDAEMLPRVTLGTVDGYSSNGPGVVGSSISDLGVYGKSTDSTGVYGISTNYIGVQAVTAASTQPALFASNLASGPAIKIGSGFIQVAGAGVGTSTFVFMHKVITGSSGNLCDSWSTVINNPLTNGDPNAILLITPNFRKSDASQSNWQGPAKDIPALFYSVAGRCGAGNDNRWAIYNQNTTSMIDNSYYNVMVIKP